MRQRKVELLGKLLTQAPTAAVSASSESLADVPPSS